VAIVTISRQLGTGALEVARRAAGLLGYACVDRELVEKAARAAGVGLQEVEQYDEKGQGALSWIADRFFGAYHFPHPRYVWGGESLCGVLPSVLNQSAAKRIRPVDREDIISAVEQGIWDHADQGDVVIVGRGAQALLADRPDAFHVRLVAPLGFRWRHIARREGITRQEALELIHKTDRARLRYLRQNYGIDWEDHAFYHLVINVAQTGAEPAAQLIAGAVPLITPPPSGQPVPRVHPGPV
jgi:cytidylate kinase